jgi:hypothetical protein
VYREPLLPYEQDSPPLPHAPAKFLFLRKLFFKRYLSNLLMAILLLLAPITFSNDSIPNFQPECEASSFLRSAESTAVAPFRRAIPIAPKGRISSPSPRYLYPAPLTPSILQIFLAAPSRAPPA